MNGFRFQDKEEEQIDREIFEMETQEEGAGRGKCSFPSLLGGEHFPHTRVIGLAQYAFPAPPKKVIKGRQRQKSHHI